MAGANIPRHWVWPERPRIRPKRRPLPFLHRFLHRPCQTVTCVTLLRSTIRGAKRPAKEETSTNVLSPVQENRNRCQYCALLWHWLSRISQFIGWGKTLLVPDMLKFRKISPQSPSFILNVTDCCGWKDVTYSIICVCSPNVVEYRLLCLLSPHVCLALGVLPTQYHRRGRRRLKPIWESNKLNAASLKAGIAENNKSKVLK